jgi:predicted nucleic acid-binding protein
MTSEPVRIVAVLDANVLFPFRLRDILLRFSDAGLFQARWSDRILAEWTDSLLNLRPELLDSIRSQRAAMELAFPEATVVPDQQPLDLPSLPDPGDQHVLATAVTCGATVIVTQNLRDFPSKTLSNLEIEAVDGNTFLARLFDLEPETAFGALEATRRSYRHPPF